MSNQEVTQPVDAAGLAQAFVAFAVEAGVLRFGEFKTKAGRMSPYFFNAGLFDDGAKLARLAQFYAQAIVASGIEFDMVFGPAYKGIPLAATVAVELARMGKNVPFAYNRKEAKDHGEGGTLVGAPLQGRVLIIDDVMSAGTAARESIALIQAAGATPHAVAIALDRQEMATENGQDVAHSAVQYVRQQLGLQVCAIATLADLLAYLGQQADGEATMAEHYQRVTAYRQRYGVAG
ncbi:MAG TPA: orotate phosphoribosyltransferase [Comamonas denitrificans]|jgi:orotate phosphoribosyltransferase|uniref:orotate phosphoribosyltransferase n=1 Tax=Comamonas denitrificans TaxID=117506 RepID=UPI001B4AA329|nr:orotate phosphoribosyltransferase [Comamonas sp.]MCZ2107156.1 orotate phosphoribosyltransferase [Burkholderiales bacterium]HRF21943.1 orotate phosphoribosyltransferase [Comamonas denitrificans]MBP7940306.1 orotate phosphoribosyltransferase [Comamonas sp.]MBP7977883.1 orotate phosphoribosyltransferase [Comamonas sp.]